MVAPSISSGLFLFTSNRMELLAAKLAQRLDTPLPSPLAPEIIVVRNKGMERWLKLELAARHGICANYEFPFPEAFGYRVFRELIPGLDPQTPWDRDVLTWRILQTLPELLPQAEFGALRQYLGEKPDSRKALQLAGRIAHLFDQYLVFRPAMVLGWDAGATVGLAPGEQWQAQLWRAVSAGFPQPHLAALWRQLSQIVAQPTLPPTNLPPRVSVFGVSAVPPFHLDLFAGLARHLQVNLFLLQPSQEYWGDITSPREGERILRRHGSEGEAAAFQLHLETGNALLASLGYLGRDFLKLLLETGDWIPDETFIEPGEGTLLESIQSDILHLRDRGDEGEAPPDAPRLKDLEPRRKGDPHPQPLSRPTGEGSPIRSRQTDSDTLDGRLMESAAATVAVDDSIQVHACHSPLRELEVLSDHMLEWFQRDPALVPRDIVVMTPDIETYAPLVQAVFGAPEEDRRFIPFSVADRAGRRQSRIIDAFLRLLELPDTRLGAASVLGLLETPAVRDRFGLEEGELETVRRWVEETNIRWGIDAAHRERLGLPALAGNTWRQGLDRLLLGYGMTGDGAQLYQGILPYDDLDGSQGLLLGRFLDFMDQLIAATQELPLARRLSEWPPFLRQLLDRFFATSEEALPELEILRDTLEELERQQKFSRFDQPLALTELIDRLAPALEEDIQQAGFLTGGVTFCGLKPMRSIPFKVVCLVGMNDRAFPRAQQHLGFDLMARRPRLGDRSTREDDRYLFLETLLSARQRLYVSYVGQSIHDNSIAPPSVLISELLDYIQRGFRGGASDGLADQLVTRHRLQAFSEDYFRPGGRLFSYSQENCRASDSVRAARRRPPAFGLEGLGAPDPRFRGVTLERLAQFLANPCKFFLTHRLGVMLPEAPAELEEREPFVLGGLEEHQIKQELVEHGLKPGAIRSLPQGQELIAAAGRLPLGQVGLAEYRRVRVAAEQFLNAVQAKRADPARPALDVDLALGEFQVTGRIVELSDAGPLCFRCATLKPGDVLRAWTAHLAANVMEPGRYTTLIAQDGARHYTPPANPRELLADLLELYWKGLQAPLKLFPASALAFVQAQRKPAKGSTATDQDALKAARKEWEGTEFNGRPAERDNAHIAFCFRDTDPLDAEFVALAQRVAGPILYQEVKELP